MVLCEPGVYTTKFKNPKIKVKSDSNEFLEGNSNVDSTVETGRENQFKEESPDSSKTSWHVTK